MRPLPFMWIEAVIDSRPHQWMDELDHGFAPENLEPVEDGDRVERRLLVELGQGRHVHGRGAVAEHGGRLGETADLGREAAQPQLHRARQRSRAELEDRPRLPFAGGDTGLGDRPGQLLEHNGLPPLAEWQPWQNVASASAES